MSSSYLLSEVVFATIPPPVQEGGGGGWRHTVCVTLAGGEQASLLHVMGEEGEKISRLIERRIEDELRAFED